MLFLQNTSEKLSVANNSKLHIAGKIQASVFNNGISLKTFFVVTKDINHTIIIDTLFIDMITPYQAHHNCITSKIKSQSDTESESEDQTIGSHALPHTLTNIEHIPDDFLNVLTQISLKKYLTFIFSEDFKLNTIALFDTGADLNCIKEGVVSKRFFYKIPLKNSLLQIIQNCILQEKPKPLFSTTAFLLKHFFVVTKDINHHHSWHSIH